MKELNEVIKRRGVAGKANGVKDPRKVSQLLLAARRKNRENDEIQN